MTGFEEREKTIVMWRDLFGVKMGRNVCSVVSFSKRAIVDGNQNGIGLGQIFCTCLGKCKLRKELGIVYKTSFG